MRLGFAGDGDLWVWPCSVEPRFVGGGEATIAGTSDMVNTQIVVANATNGANEGNNSKITAQTASFIRRYRVLTVKLLIK